MSDETATGETPPLPVTTARDSEGRFVKGVSGNPNGRPPANPEDIGTHKLTQLSRKLEYAVRQSISEDKIKRIVDKMADMAIDGNVRAAKLILDKVISNASPPSGDEQEDNTRKVVFQITNHTYAAVQKTADAPKALAIDVEVVPVNNPLPQESE
jgi:hypothetical protein